MAEWLKAIERKTPYQTLFAVFFDFQQHLLIKTPFYEI